MAPWDEPSSRTCYDSKMEFLQMEKEKVANKAAKEMMNHIRELFPALDDEEVLEEQIYEESYQEDLMMKIQMRHMKKALISRRAHQEENMMSCDPFEDLDDTLFHDLGSEEVLEETLDMIDPLEEK
jgi:hypothetical protein